ncbi:APO protein 2, chloroplastic-like isoform X1 [Telopea speciosissima]|uniref:APO protein 2, chloroplastic-like isoform X1 n=1 Tax=Telopea speciosissima TaxID=54955 RepID=UPI001CC4CC6A|nr:APO protein 2, chloroplastic-like isoform X1 [Telopea speciosissima]
MVSGMGCASAQYPIGIKDLVIYRSGSLPLYSSSFRVPYHLRGESLKLKLYQHLSWVDSSKCGGNEYKLQVMFRFPPQIPFQNCSHVLVVKSNYPQNADFPPYYSKKEKKPFPIPVLELRRAARERKKKSMGQPRRLVPPPRNGLLVQRLIPVAYEVLNARVTLINNLKKLMKVVPVQACKWCNEIHVGSVGHPFKSCKGPRTEVRRGRHEWTNSTVQDVLLPVEAFHLFDRLGKRITHQERFSIPRIPAVVELCIQAGVDLPDLPTKRRRKPVIRIGRNEIIDADESELPDPTVEVDRPILSEVPDLEIVPPSNPEEISLLSEETLQAWETMREGALKLMKRYSVRVCGYCPEVHVGSSGHKAQNCGAYKHQQRNGQHGWQAALLDDLIPPRYVWHVPDVNGPPLELELRSFYGQAPAVVEICVQGGAAVPEQYKSTMRLDVGIPSNVKEAEMVV